MSTAMTPNVDDGYDRTPRREHGFYCHAGRDAKCKECDHVAACCNSPCKPFFYIMLHVAVFYLLFRCAFSGCENRPILSASQLSTRHNSNTDLAKSWWTYPEVPHGGWKWAAWVATLRQLCLATRLERAFVYFGLLCVRFCWVEFFRVGLDCHHLASASFQLFGLGGVGVSAGSSMVSAWVGSLVAC